jgi:NAD kinase
MKVADSAQAPIGSVAVYTHRRPEVTGDVVRMLTLAAERAGVELRFDPDETAKHGLEDIRVENLRTNAENGKSADLCIVLGGDGTTLRSMREYAGTGTPVFSINCGRVGFLATVDRGSIAEGLERALGGNFEVMRLPALLLEPEGERQFALNDQALSDYIFEGISKTFDQDRAILEAQQREIGDDPDRAHFPVAIRVDAGPIQGRKLVAAMLAREAELERSAATAPAA